jgi:hypothetical protein
MGRAFVPDDGAPAAQPVTIMPVTSPDFFK